ncbi:hypothetical protein COL154_013148 [Colletotrichum chrysophilum]|uniref:uncharacterized protein n=1 Tax=Colletotrichum chrysophilum TaxID=1836956 RepID=UPI0023009D8F|nr:uncharacterized protein COL26b_001865 [Colletotrichum chrysophilum]KAJ0350861.1 hypothetical protein COL154_013148 [Colletotrichum chrysophilum]KAJ0355085.1 hypothetical protein KNSL1_000804 [Colletotrichum chrysophilum]KAJ0379715.1 hypothetical protein COL26b_001865 [Colletotrichum chrysophilum]
MAAVNDPMDLELGDSPTKLSNETVARKTPKIIVTKSGSKKQGTLRNQEPHPVSKSIHANSAIDNKTLRATNPQRVTKAWNTNKLERKIAKRRSRYLKAREAVETLTTTPPSSDVSDSELSTTKAQRTLAERRSRYLEALEEWALPFTPPSSDVSDSDDELSTTKLEDETTATATPGTNDIAQVTPCTPPSEDVKFLVNPKIILHGETFRWNKVSDGIYQKADVLKKPKIVLHTATFRWEKLSDGTYMKVNRV